MSRTKHSDKFGNEFPAKSKKKLKDKKWFGFTDGLHSKLEEVKMILEKQIKDNPNDLISIRQLERLKDKKYTVKGEDFIKYGYGQRRKNN